MTPPALSPSDLRALHAKATLRRNADGTERVYTYVVEREYWNSQEFLWTEGNYACDCNRSLLFAYAAGEEGDLDRECGDGAFTLVRLELPDGRWISDDEGDWQAPQSIPKE